MHRTTTLAFVVLATASTALAGPLSPDGARYVKDTLDLESKCALDAPPPHDWQHLCWMNGDDLEQLYRRVDEKSDPQVEEAHAYLGKLHVTVEQWKAEAKAAAGKQRDDARNRFAMGRAENDAREVLASLRQGRDGKIESKLISVDNTDAQYVAHRLDELTHEFPAVDRIAQSCAQGGGSPELCDLAAKRDDYFAKFKALQWDAILSARLADWTGAIKGLSEGNDVQVKTYNVITNPSKMATELGGDLGAIATALGQTDTKAAIGGKLDKLHVEFMAALKSQMGTNAWAAHAKEATGSEPAFARALHGVDGLTLVRVAVAGPTWEIIRGALDRPVQRNRYGWAMLRKPGESFCRVYQVAVIEDYQGGGSYGAPRPDFGAVPSFYVSTCK